MDSRTMSWLLGLVMFLVGIMSLTEASRAEIFERLSILVEKDQITTANPFGGGPEQLEGTYHCDILINSHGKCEQYMMRKMARMPVIQSFLTNYVAVLLFDAFRFGKAPRPSQKSVERIAKMLQGFLYKNMPFNNSIVTFFPQVYDEEHDFWKQKSVDFATILHSLKSLDLTPEKAARLLMGNNLPPDLTGYFEPDKIGRSSEVPPDFDCTGVHLSFGAFLYLYRNEFPEAWDIWNKNNPNITSVFDAGKKYAYRPFSDDPDDSFIDPRTYYISRHFLDEAKRQGRDLVLLTTWVQNFQEIQTQYKKGIVIPWGVNNVDVAVIANYFAGIISSVTFGLVDPHVINDDADFNVLLDSTADFLVHIVESNIEDRPDIATFYYPSMFQVYWFIGRDLMLMENGKVNGPLPVPALERYYQKLAKVMRKEATRRILELKTVGENGDIYYDDFLGNADLSYYDRPIKRHEDRIFTTSMAANSLVSIWTVHDETYGLRWIEETPKIVKRTAYGCARWLEANTLTGEYSPTSIFFSGDFSFDTLPFWYPANRFQYINGTNIDGFSFLPSELTSIGVQGYVDPDEYERMMKVHQFGVTRPEKFEDFNKATGTRLFAGGNSFTFASVMMTLSMTEQLEDKEHL